MRKRQSTAPKRRKTPTRKPIQWTGWVWGLAAANILAGLAFSPATSATKIRVRGAEEADRAGIVKAIQKMKNQPALRVNAASLKTDLRRLNQVEAAILDLTLFGTGVLKVTPRVPVARIEGKGLAMDRNGSLFRFTAAGGSLPLMKLPPSALEANASIAGTWESDAGVELADLVRTKLPEGEWRISIDQRAVAEIRQSGSARVKLGTTADLDEKVEALAQILQQKPGILSSISEINLSSPSYPVYKP